MPHGDAWILRTAAERRRSASTAAGAIPDRRLPGFGERAYTGYRSGALATRHQRWFATAGELDLGRVRGPAADDLARRYPLCNQVVEAGYNLERRNHRRLVASRGHRAPDRVP